MCNDVISMRENESNEVISMRGKVRVMIRVAHPCKIGCIEWREEGKYSLLG